MDTNGNLTHLRNLVAAATADGLTDLAAEYAAMAATYERQLVAEARIDAAAEKDARSQVRLQDIKDARYELETSGLRAGQFGRKERHEAGMYQSNLYLNIRNAVYFE